jgi:DNA-binding transcriptional LysR family regulator
VKKQRSQVSSPDFSLVTDSLIRPTFTIEQIRTFLAVAAREHVTHAAQVLRLSQPAVTQQVQLFERALGVRLLERVGRNVRLTNAGVEVAGVCLVIMRALENLERVVQGLRGLDRGSVTVGATELTANVYLPSVLSEFTTAHPGINVGVVVAAGEDVCQDVTAGNLECGLVDGTHEPLPNLVRTEVTTTDVSLVASPRNPLCGGRALSADLLRASRFLVWESGSAMEAIAVAALGNRYECASPLFVGSMEAARRTVIRSSNFLTVMPSVAVAEDIASGALVALREHCGRLPVYAVRRQGPDTPGVEALWQTLIRRPGAGG